MYQLRADPEIIDRGLLELYLREPGTQKLIDEMKTGISDSGLNLTHSRFATLIIPLPPLNEQKRIVSKIEELFSELDSGEESLRRARRQLGVYRQSLLKQAFEGKLTAPWRQQNPHLLESPEQLLKRIQAERQARYDQQMQEWETIDRKNSKKSKPPKPKNTAPLEKDVAAKLPELPPCWRWHSLAGVCNVLCGYAFKSGDFIEAGVPVIKIANVSYGEFVIKTQEYLHERFLVENVEFIIRPGDLLIALTRPITNNKTKVCEYPINQPVALLNQRVAALKTPDVSSRYMMLYALSSHFRDSIRSKFSETLQPNLSPKDLSDTPFPLCSLPEQQEIVRLLDEQFTVIAQNEQEIDAALKRSEALRQSILKKAFTGQLVPQDPNDEHASTLLERIRREREQATATQPKKKTAAKHG
jgi:type I restriction enzyme S subunit